MPSLTEGFPMAALEAMAQGLPVVASNVGGLPELVEDGRTGILVPPTDVGALANALRILAADAQRRREMGMAGWRRTQEHFSVDRMVAQTAEIFPELRFSVSEIELRVPGRGSVSCSPATIVLWRIKIKLGSHSQCKRSTDGNHPVMLRTEAWSRATRPGPCSR